MRFGNVKGLASFSLFAMEGCVLAISDFVSKVEGSVRPRHLGLGFVWAWIYCSFSTSALFAGRAGSSINADSSWFASAVAVVGCFFVFALAWRRVDMSCIRPAAFAGTVLMAAGTFFLGAFDLPAWAGTLCGVASGIGSGLLVLFWGDAYSHLETERVEIAVPAASGVMLACAFVFPYIQGLPGACGLAHERRAYPVCLAEGYAGHAFFGNAAFGDARSLKWKLASASGESAGVPCEDIRGAFCRVHGDWCGVCHWWCDRRIPGCLRF